MGRLANSLKAAIEYSGYSRAEICAKSGVEPASLSKYLSGRAVPKKEPLAKLTAVLPYKYKALVYIAYIKDTLPDDVEDCVFFNTPADSSSRLGEDTVEYKFEEKVPLPKDLSEAFEGLKEMAIKNPAVAEMILTSYRVVCGVS